MDEKQAEEILKIAKYNAGAVNGEYMKGNDLHPEFERAKSYLEGLADGKQEGRDMAKGLVDYVRQIARKDPKVILESAMWIYKAKQIYTKWEEEG